MADEIFTEPENGADQWADVRMTDPEKGEWDIDAVVVGGRVAYVDLRVQPERLSAFVECLLDDVSAERARAILADVAGRDGDDRRDGTDEE